MTKKIIVTTIMLSFVLMIATAAFAGGSSNTCKTKNPMVLAHGMFAHDDMLGFIDYWWGIEDALEDEGARVYITNVNAYDSTADKAVAWRNQLLQILATSGASKVNVLGHSHGGIYTRYAISNLGMASRVASHTSYCSPQRGSSCADVILDVVPDPLHNVAGWFVDTFIAGFIFGDTNPNSLENGINVTRPYMMNVFNPNTPNKPGIYYQSYATKIKTITADLILEPSWLIIKYHEGSNDGLVSITSAKWGTFRGTESGAWWCGGVSHINAIGHFFGITPGFNAGNHMVDIVADLKNKGY